MSRFGSGIVASGTGFALHDRGGLFTMDAPSPNALAGGSGAAYDYSRVLRRRATRGWRLALWAAGHLIAGTRAVHSGSRGLQDEHSGGARSPRFSKHSFGGCDVMMENRFSQKVREELAAKGHQDRCKKGHYEPPWAADRQYCGIFWRRA